MVAMGGVNVCVGQTQDDKVIDQVLDAPRASSLGQEEEVRLRDLALRRRVLCVFFVLERVPF
jgi:hypothetical protein